MVDGSMFSLKATIKLDEMSREVDGDGVTLVTVGAANTTQGRNTTKSSTHDQI